MTVAGPSSLPGQISFLTNLAFTLSEEGGLTDDPNDPGGVTNLGVTVYSWTPWIGHIATPADIAALTIDTVVPMYHNCYWNAVRGWGLPDGVALMVFDHAVNAGVSASSRVLQSLAATMQNIYTVIIDNQIGPITANAARAVGSAKLLPALNEAQLADYRNKANWPTYKDGWTARLGRRYALALRQATVPVAAPL